MNRLLLIVSVLWVAGAVVSMPTDAQDETGLYRVMGGSAVNARACPRLDCAVVATLEPGTTVQVVETVNGDEVFGTNLWRRTIYNGADVYLHSALLGPASVTDTHVALTEAVSTDDWVEHIVAGTSIKTPPHWVETTEYHTFPVSEPDEQEAESVEAFQMPVVQETLTGSEVPANHIILTDPQTLSTVDMWVEYTGIDSSLLATQSYFENRIEELGQLLDSSQIVRLPANDAIRLRARIIYEPENPSPVYDDERLIYYLVSERVEYSIFLTARQIVFDDMKHVFRAIIDSLQIQSSEAARAAVTQSAGSAHVGENPRQLTENWMQVWTYQGQAGELVNIRAVAQPGIADDLDIFLIIRAPDGRIIAENDDSGLFNLSRNPHIRRLELPESGTYEIEVHAYIGFTSGEYTLIIENGTAQATPEPKGNAALGMVSVNFDGWA